MRCKDAVQLASLTRELQNIAQSAGFQRPLIIGIDQENGMVCRDTGRHAWLWFHLYLCDMAR